MKERLEKRTILHEKIGSELVNPRVISDMQNCKKDRKYIPKRFMYTFATKKATITKYSPFKHDTIARTFFPRN